MLSRAGVRALQQLHQAVVTTAMPAHCHGNPRHLLQPGSQQIMAWDPLWMPQIKSLDGFQPWSACFGSPRGGFRAGLEDLGAHGLLGASVFAQGWWWSFRSLLKPPGRSCNLNSLSLPLSNSALCCLFHPCLGDLDEFGFSLGVRGGSRPWAEQGFGPALVLCLLLVVFLLGAASLLPLRATAGLGKTSRKTQLGHGKEKVENEIIPGERKL